MSDIVGIDIGELIKQLNKLSDEISFLKIKLERIKELAEYSSNMIARDGVKSALKQNLNEIIKLSESK